MKSVQLILLMAFGLMARGLLSAQVWTQTSAPTNTWMAIASSADGTKLVAVAGGQFATGPIYSSTNAGGNWLLTSAPTSHWNAVASSANGSKLSAVAYGGRIFTSTNAGANWMTNNVANQSWQAIASSADGSKLAAVSLASLVFLSTNAGAIWFSNAAPIDSEQVATSADSSLLAVGNNVGLMYVSTNSGASWAYGAALSGKVTSLAASANGSRLIAVSAGAPGPRVYTSTNAGITWVTNNVPNRSDWFACASSADGSNLAVIGKKGVIYTPADAGQTWISNSVPGLFWSAVASSADGSQLVAATSNGGIWIFKSTPTPRLNLTTVSNQLSFAWTVPATHLVLQQSADLSSWTTVTNPPTLNVSNLQNQVVLPPSGSRSFYRLKTP